jgi:arylamine N-acetyltransferase
VNNSKEFTHWLGEVEHKVGYPINQVLARDAWKDGNSVAEYANVFILEDAAEQHRLLIQDISRKLYIAEHGMGMPYSRDDVLHYRRLLVEALAAEPRSAAVKLACMLVQS